jgi:hypothetical protein
MGDQTITRPLTSVQNLLLGATSREMNPVQILNRRPSHIQFRSIRPSVLFPELLTRLWHGWCPNYFKPFLTRPSECSLS